MRDKLVWAGMRIRGSVLDMQAKLEMPLGHSIFDYTRGLEQYLVYIKHLIYCTVTTQVEIPNKQLDIGVWKKILVLKVTGLDEIT